MLVATDIAARGIHVDEIELVVHVDPPAEHKAYLHRSGRTARAGASGVVVTVTTPDQDGDTRILMQRAGISPTPGHGHPGRRPAPRAHRAPRRGGGPGRRPARRGPPGAGPEPGPGWRHPPSQQPGSRRWPGCRCGGDALRRPWFRRGPSRLRRPARGRRASQHRWRQPPRSRRTHRRLIFSSTSSGPAAARRGARRACGVGRACPDRARAQERNGSRAGAASMVASRGTLASRSRAKPRTSSARESTDQPSAEPCSVTVTRCRVTQCAVGRL